MKRMMLVNSAAVTAFILLVSVTAFAADGDLIVNGKMGIGTTNPAVDMQVTRSSDGVYMRLVGPSHNTQLSEDATGGELKLVSNGILRFGTNNMERMRLDNVNGSLCIGSTVAGSDKVNVYTNISGGRGLYAQNDGTGGGGIGAYGIAWNFHAYGPGLAYGSSSSIRWKKNIVKIDGALKKVQNMRGVYFDWDEKHGGTHSMGMIAEEVGKIVPEIVAYEKNGKDATSIDYGRLTPVLVEAIKEQQKHIEELKARIAVLEKAKKN